MTVRLVQPVNFRLEAELQTDEKMLFFCATEYLSYNTIRVRKKSLHEGLQVHLITFQETGNTDMPAVADVPLSLRRLLATKKMRMLVSRLKD